MCVTGQAKHGDSLIILFYINAVEATLRHCRNVSRVSELYLNVSPFHSHLPFLIHSSRLPFALFNMTYSVMSPKCQSFHNSSKMATRYFHKLLSLFYRQRDGREETHSFKTLNADFGDWTTVEDIPPPYTDSPNSETHDQYLPPPPFEAHCLGICPHETIPFDDLQKIVKSLTINGTDDTINALTTSCHEHRSYIDPVTTKNQTVCVSPPGLLRGSGTYALEDGKGPSHIPKVVLCFDWNLGLIDGIRGQIETAAELQQFLGAEGIPLCSHRLLSDSNVINAIFNLVKRPLSQDVIIGCDQCPTEIKVMARNEGDDQLCHVTTKRYLGTVEKPDDSEWLAQCGV